MSQIYLVRHGETPWVVTGQHTGRTDLALTEQGQRQADRLKPKLKGLACEKIFCSPLERAKETCTRAGFMEHAVINPNLIEWDYGTYEGLTRKEILNKNPQWNIFQNGAPQGESPQQVASRARAVLCALTAVEGNALLFSHGHFLRILTAVWLGLPLEAGNLFLLSAASISILGYEREKKSHYTVE